MTLALEWIKPSDIRDKWPLIIDGVKQVEKNIDDWLAEDLYMSIKTGACNLHIGTIDGEYKGFIILQKQENFGLTLLHVWASYSNAKDFNILHECNAQIEEWAKAIEAKKITFSSTRRGWARQAIKLGFKPTITIYEKEVIYG